MGRRRAQRFPVGVYATLLGALCWVAVPQLTRGLERVLVGAFCLPLRAYSSLGTPARAAAAEAADPLLVRSLIERQQQAAAALAEPADMQPVVCRVVERLGTGGGGAAAELILDRTYAELRGCGGYVSHGNRLVGFLARPGHGAAEGDRLQDPARVLLLNHPRSPAVPAVWERPGEPALRCMVEPAGTVDRWPLRCSLWEDPYRASRVARSGGELRTLALDGLVPGGLAIGSSRVWGYRLGAQRVPIGVYARPAADPRLLTAVVLWRKAPGAAEDLRPPPLAGMPGVELLRVPGPAGSRLLANGSWSLTFPAEAALVRGLRWLGTARGLGPGQAMVEPFEASRRAWSLLLLPEAGPPVGLRGEVTSREGAGVWVRLLDDARGGLGHLFTGVNGRHSPAGLLVGRVLRVSREADRLLVERPADRAAALGVEPEVASIFIAPAGGGTER